MKNPGFNFKNTYTNLPDNFFTESYPEEVKFPEVVIFNKKLANSLDLDFANHSSSKIAKLLAGQEITDNIAPISQAYAGHQFGNFVILGDGRAHLLGEHITKNNKRFDIALKGSGRTIYSRSGDGKAAIGPMLREYIISEAMHNLRIPTTRSLAVVTTGEKIIRDTKLPGAILTRVASSHIRVGTFEFAAYSHGIEELMNYTIERHYPDIIGTENKAIALLKAVMEKQIDLITNWMRVGFIHGVMNTDNMALSGETIDYGPCAFMDDYNPDCVFSSIDHNGRYAYTNQPKIAQWNLAIFAETLLPLIHDNEKKAITLAGDVIMEFQDIYKNKWHSMMSDKLGLLGIDKEDQNIILDLLRWMQSNNADYTNTFYDLTYENIGINKLYEQIEFKNWHLKWQARIEKNEEPRSKSIARMKYNNPVLIPRNHRVDQALQAANIGDYSICNKLLSVLEEPYKAQKSKSPYQQQPKENERIYQTFCGT